MHGNDDGTVPATFQVIYMVGFSVAPNATSCSVITVKIGWKPSPTQRQPLERGTAETNLKDAL